MKYVRTNALAEIKVGRIFISKENNSYVYLVKEILNGGIMASPIGEFGESEEVYIGGFELARLLHAVILVQ